MIRIGQGYDVHAFTKGNEITLAGIKIPFDKSFKAHSDGDVLIHSVCDALLGALSLGDIGLHFPPSDPKWENCESSVFLTQVYKMIKAQGYRLGNLDCTVICEKPKLKPYISIMRENLSKILNEPIDQISIKATTTERLGFCGREEGVAVQSVCIISKG